MDISIDAPDTNKTREQLIHELRGLRAQLASEKRQRLELSLELAGLKSIHLLQSIFDNIPVLLVMWDSRLKNFKLNRCAEDVIGWTTKEANEVDFMSKVYPDTSYRAEVQNFMLSLKPCRQKWKITTKNGEHVPIDWTNIRINEDTVISIGVDLRERKQTEQVLKQSEQRYRELVQNANSAIIRWRFDGTITFFNEYAQTLFGYSAEEVLGKHVSLLVPPVESSGTDLTGLVKDIVNNPQHYIININENVCKDGRRIWIAWTNRAITDRRGEVSEILAIGSDISELKRTEDALRESEQRYRQLLSVLPAAMYTCDKNGLITYYNEQAAKLWGRSPRLGDPDELFCGSLRLYAPDDSPLPHNQTPMANVLLSGTGIRAQEVKIEQPDGSRLFLLVNIDPLRDSSGRLCGAINVFTDITEHKRTEAALNRLNETLEQRVAERTKIAETRAKQLQALTGELIKAEENERRRIAMLLHDDLQQILVSAKFQTEMLMASLKDHTTQIAKMLLDTIYKATDSCRTLSHELNLYFMYNLDLGVVLKKIVRQMEKNYGLRIKSTIELDNIPISENTKIFIGRTVQELLFNCAKHAESDWVVIEIYSRGNFLTVIVEDNGVGFDPAGLRVRGGDKGGIGLFGIQERTEALGGTFQFDSSPNNGSRFVLNVPFKNKYSEDDKKFSTSDMFKLLIDSYDLEKEF